MDPAHERMFIDPCPGVVLLHTLSDGSHHFDLLLSTQHTPPSAEERCLVSFRLADALAWGESTEVEAEIMDPHRAHYLDYEGHLSGGRGAVVRVDDLMVRWGKYGAGRMTFLVLRRPDILAVDAHDQGGGRWQLSMSPVPTTGR